ncbi:hypothetical protein [Natronocalculus amylovorans]|nr:hypothetical protein [Natronocalculus amylovorans]
MSVTVNRYPVVHTLGSVFSDATGLELHHTFMILVVVFTVCFFVFIPLTIRRLTYDSRLAYVGLYSGFLLLPINHLSPSLYIHPTSQAIMYAPVIIYTFIAAYREPNRTNSIIFLLVSTMFVFLHLQQAANLIVFFAMIAALQVGRSVLTNKRGVASGKLVYSLVAVFGLVFWLWVQNIETFWTSVADTILVPFTETEVAQTAASRGVSLGQVGGSVEEVFLKLFLVSVVYSVLAAILMIGVLLRSSKVSSIRLIQDVFTSDSHAERLLLLYFIGGFVAVSSIFFIYLIGGISDQYFRHQGTIMVFVTMLGAIALGRAMIFFGRHSSARAARGTTAAVLVVFLVLTLPIIFSSPYIYYTSDHVTEAHINGYETTFEYQEDTMSFDVVRSSVDRYGNAIQGREIPRDAYYREDEDGNVINDGIPDHFASQSLREYYDQRMYVPVTDADRIRDPILWNGFRFSHDDFRYLDNEPGINKVQSNGGYDLYVIEPIDEISF